VKNTRSTKPYKTGIAVPMTAVHTRERDESIYALPDDVIHSGEMWSNFPDPEPWSPCILTLGKLLALTLVLSVLKWDFRVRVCRGCGCICPICVFFHGVKKATVFALPALIPLTDPGHLNGNKNMISFVRFLETEKENPRSFEGVENTDTSGMARLVSIAHYVSQ